MVQIITASSYAGLRDYAALCLANRLYGHHEERGYGAQEQGNQEPIEAATVLGLGQSRIYQGQGSPAYSI